MKLITAKLIARIRQYLWTSLSFLLPTALRSITNLFLSTLLSVMLNLYPITEYQRIFTPICQLRIIEYFNQKGSIMIISQAKSIFLLSCSSSMGSQNLPHVSSLLSSPPYIEVKLTSSSIDFRKANASELYFVFTASKHTFTSYTLVILWNLCIALPMFGLTHLILIRFSK